MDEDIELSELVLALFPRTLDFSYPLANVLVSLLKSEPVLNEELLLFLLDSNLVIVIIG